MKEYCSAISEFSQSYLNFVIFIIFDGHALIERNKSEVTHSYSVIECLFDLHLVLPKKLFGGHFFYLYLSHIISK